MTSTPTLAEFVADDALQRTDASLGPDQRLAEMLRLIAAESIPGLTIDTLEAAIIRACRQRVGL